MNDSRKIFGEISGFYSEGLPLSGLMHHIRYMNPKGPSGVIFPFILILFTISLLAAFSGVSADPTVIVTGYKISPDVLLPGDIGTIEVTVANTAQQASKTASESYGKAPDTLSTVTVPVNAFIESGILKTKDFTIISGWYEDIGEIGPGQSTTLTFLVQAPVREGVYFPEIWIRVRGAENVKYPIPVNVNTRHTLIKQPSLRLSRGHIGDVIPGSSFEIPITLQNEGFSAAHDITIEIKTPDTSLSSLSPERQFIKELKPGDTRQVILSFLTDSDIPTGIQQIPVRLTYLNADGTSIEQTEQVGVLVKGTGEVGIAKQTLDPQQVYLGDLFSLVFRIENTGTDKAKSVSASLDLPFEGTKEAFVGTIGPDSDAPAVFTLKASESGDIPFNLTIRYKDDFGTHEEVIGLHIFVGEKNGNGMYLLILVFILAGAGFLLWRRRNSS